MERIFAGRALPLVLVSLRSTGHLCWTVGSCAFPLHTRPAECAIALLERSLAGLALSCYGARHWAYVACKQNSSRWLYSGAQLGICPVLGTLSKRWSIRPMHAVHEILSILPEVCTGR